MSETIDKGNSPSAFAGGQQDCRNGVAHQSGKGTSYDMGYAFEYEMEQILNAEGDRQWRMK